MHNEVEEAAKLGANLFRSGMAVERTRVLEPIVIAYDRALKDPNTKMPSYLHAVLEQARLESKK